MEQSITPDQKRIAIIGASADRSKYGNKAVRAYKQQGFTVYPVNPREPEIEGLTAFTSISAVPDAVDQASFYVPPEVGLKVIEEVAQKGIRTVWLNPGAESDELLARAEELGLEVIVACSIVGIGLEPDDV